MNAPIQTKEIAQALIDNARPDSNGQHKMSWPKPLPLPDELPPVQAFDFALLPSTFRPFVKDIAERVQCPADFPAIAAMAVSATVVGRKIGIRPKRFDDWIVVPNLWCLAIGRPGVMKTPAIQQPLALLKLLEIKAKDSFEQALIDHRTDELLAEQRIKIAKGKIKEELESSEDNARRLAREAVTSKCDAPTRRRYVVNDPTVEKLGEILNENPNGVLLYRDEFFGFLKSLEKEGCEGARAFMLESWNGDGRYTWDRIGRGTIDIDAAILSMLGSIQPGPLRHYVRNAAAENAGADGLIQRIQLAVYPDVCPNWRNVDRWPDGEAKQLAADVVKWLDQLDPTTIGAERDSNSGPDSIPFLRFEEEAQVRFDEWRSQLEYRLRSGIEHPVIESHLAKYRSLIPSLALLIHLAEQQTGRVGIEALERAIAWGYYLESHARRIYAAAVTPDTIEAGILARKIMKGAVPEEFALRDIYRKKWAGLADRETVTRAVQVLVDHDWLAEIVVPTLGRSKTLYIVNPRISDLAGEQGAKGAKSP